MIDTRASINVIDGQTFSKFREVTLKSAKTKAFAYNQFEPVNFLGKFEAVVETRKRMTVAPFCGARTELWQPIQLTSLFSMNKVDTLLHLAPT